MRDIAAHSVSSEVITQAHTIKFARKARDFFAAYRTGASGKDVEKQRLAFKAHRCMLDCFFNFVTEDQIEKADSRKQNSFT